MLHCWYHVAHSIKREVLFSKYSKPLWVFFDWFPVIDCRRRWLAFCFVFLSVHEQGTSSFNSPITSKIHLVGFDRTNARSSRGRAEAGSVTSLLRYKFSPQPYDSEKIAFLVRRRPQTAEHPDDPIKHENKTNHVNRIWQGLPWPEFGIGRRDTLSHFHDPVLTLCPQFELNKAYHGSTHILYLAIDMVLQPAYDQSSSACSCHPLPRNLVAGIFCGLHDKWRSF